MIKIIVQTSKMQCEKELPTGCVCTISTMDDKDVNISIFKPKKRTEPVKVSKIKKYNRRKINIPLETQSAIIADYTSGMSLRNLEIKYKISNSTIRRKLKEIGVYGKRLPPKRKSDAIYDPKIKEEIVAMYQSGLSMHQISEEKKMSPHIVSKIIKQAGIPIRKYSEEYTERIKERNQKIVEAYKSGMTWQEIAEKCEVAKMTISKVLKKEGISTSRR